MSTTRIYLVTDTETNKHRLIRAGNQAQAIQHAAQTVLIWIWRGVESAKVYWTEVDLPKPKAPVRTPTDRLPKRKRTTR